MKKKILNFIAEVKIELGKVSWLERKVVRITTVVVVVFMLIFAFYIGVIDIIFSKIITLFLR